MKLYKTIGLILFAANAVSALAATGVGVPIEMAKFRKNIISDVIYDLRFDIPELQTDAIKGTCEITFNLKESENIPIDYCNPLNNSNIDIIANGHRFNAEVVNEHLVIPADLMKTGCNSVLIPFVSDNKVLNRHDDYLYTLFVPANARKAFPCFDQPDLKAKFTLTLRTPRGWKAVSNSPIMHYEDQGDVTVSRFAVSKPLPTYLFSFVAGKFDETTETVDGREMTAYYRETDTEKIKQLPEVFQIAAQSIKWLEEYTAIPYPFDKYDFVILPGYQFGGMEHPGAIQFNDTRIFLPANHTADDELTRLNLIAHETAHMWFGDLVTMSWFNDVWTKEIFANFMADKISREYFADYDYDLTFVKSHYEPAYNVDRTEGKHPIQQPLDNLNNAGLLYGNIIYHKAPIMMRKLEEYIGNETLQKAVRLYLKDYSYGNATWDDLISAISAVAPEKDIDNFDRVWVKEAGMPEISASISDGKLQYVQKRATNAQASGMVWRQDLKVGVIDGNASTVSEIVIPIMGDSGHVELPDVGREELTAIPNIDGLCYGSFPLSDRQISAICDNLSAFGNAGQRQAIAMLIYENCIVHNRISTPEAFEVLRNMLESEGNDLVAMSLADYLIALSRLSIYETQSRLDDEIYQIVETSKSVPIKTKLLKYLCANTNSPEVLAALGEMWENTSQSLLSARDYMALSYRLAMFNPDRCEDILARQRTRITNNDMVEEFDYVSRGCTPDKSERQRLFLSLINPQNRVNEPWARDLLGLLCDKGREADTRDYLEDALDNLQYIQSTSDIFFPSTWLGAILGKCRTEQSREIVEKWLEENQQLNEPLKRKILENLFYIRN